MCVCGRVVETMTADTAECEGLDSLQTNRTDEKSIHLTVFPDSPGNLTTFMVPTGKSDGDLVSNSNDASRKNVATSVFSAKKLYLNCDSCDIDMSESDGLVGNKEGSDARTKVPPCETSARLLATSDDSQTKGPNGTQSASNISDKSHGQNKEEVQQHSLREEDYFKPLKKLRMIRHLVKSDEEAKPLTQPRKNHSGVKSFSISDILANTTSSTSDSTLKANCSSDLNEDKMPVRNIQPASPSRFIRPWDTDEEDTHEARSTCSRSSASSDSPRPASSGPILESLSKQSGSSHFSRIKGGGNPLDALFKMTSKTFDGSNDPSGTDNSCKQLGLFNTKQPIKRKRKSRTAFSNHQLFELEKRFLYQKYLSPVDRDELAQGLGLSNAQVITWFQNRRAKLKRDMEEIKKDVHTASVLGDHTSFIKTMTQMGILRNKSALDLTYMGSK